LPPELISGQWVSKGWPTFCTDSGPDKGIAIDVQGKVEAIQLTKNTLRETRGQAERIGIRIGAETKQIDLADNRIEGFAQAVADLRKP
jgi:hypothetical protein